MFKHSYFENFIFNSSDVFFTSDIKGNIKYINKSGSSLLGLPKNIEEIEHLFNFDVCIINSENYFDFNPLKEALNSSITIKIEVLYQLSISSFKKFLLTSWKMDETCFFSLVSLENQIVTQEKLKKLENELKESKHYRLKAHSLALRNALINSIAIELKDSLNNDEIIEKALNNITNLLGAGYGAFILIDQYNKIAINKLIENSLKINALPNLNFDNVSISNITQNGINEISIPVRNKNQVFGYFVFAKTDKIQIEEITLVETISAQIASALAQAELFSKIECKNKELQSTLNELKQTQVKLIQSEKMASLGQLVAGVAHEINTPLGAIKNNNSILSSCAEKLQGAKENNVKAELYLKILSDTITVNKEAISRITEIVKSLKNFARLDESEYKKADINEGIKNTILLIKHELKNKIELKTDFAELPLVLCYPNLLNQVFMNLIMNAIQSIEDTGTIEIITQIANNKVLISISDTGVGISEKNLLKIFDPGFTTKGMGVGTGLGLSICYQIIQKHKGQILINSLVGECTTFTLELPLE